MITIPIKPLSVNECWQGRRYKTKKYESYEKLFLLMLPAIKLPPAPYRISFEFGVSSQLADFDNPVKPATDVLQKKYGFNDKDVHEATIKKVLVAKGKEYIGFQIESLGLNLNDHHIKQQELPVNKLVP